MRRRDFLKAAALAAPTVGVSRCLSEEPRSVALEDTQPSQREDEGTRLKHRFVDIGSAKQLIVDEYLLESSRGVRLVMNPPNKKGRVLVRDQPWELHEGTSINGYSTIMRDAGRIRLWYALNHTYSPLLTWGTRDRVTSVFYAESEDGIHFEKPKLGLHEFYGTKKNNLIIPGPVQGGHVWLDPHATAEHRYRLQGNGPGGLDFYSSPDGIVWKRTHSCRLGKVDGRSNIFWDDKLGRYVLFTRYFRYPAKLRKGGYRGTRKVRRLESDDLVHWDNEKIVLEPDEIDRATRPSAVQEQPPVDYNYATVFRYPDNYGLTFMLVTTYWHWFDRSWRGIQRSSSYNLGPNANDIRLAVSRDGEKFTWLGGRRPFIRLGMEGDFDSRMLHEMAYPLDQGNELWFYYTGRNWEHGPAPSEILDRAAQQREDGIGRVVLRKDGFVSADAPYTGGELVTRPLLFSGDRLLLNADTSGGGVIRVEIQNLDGSAVAGYAKADCHPINGNSVAYPVVWKQHKGASSLAGKPVKLRFVMADCKLYAFQFQN